MNKTSIWIIIALMTSALVVVVWIQVNWINWAIRLNEEQFNKDIFEALNKVADKLEADEANLVMKEIRKSNNITIGKDNLSILTDTNDSETHVASLVDNGKLCNCADCLEQRSKMLDNYEKIMVKRWADFTPLGERIIVSHLDEYLHQELSSRGVAAKYSYGVFANEERSFVIADNHYVVADEQPQVLQTGFNNLYNSEYRVHLFPQDLKSPGLLMVYFPTRASIVWGSVWQTFLLSIIFTSIILFCFFYTVQVIFRQKKLSEMKNDFINNMTHEFKTPIATISLATDSITSPMILSNQDKIKRFAEIIRQENRRMNSQVEKVLQMALIDKNDFELNISNIDIHEMIQRAVDNFSLQVEKKEGVIHTRLDAEKTHIEGDITHISSIIHNLLDNANKYSPEKPDITISTRNVPLGIEIQVSDKGIGMNKETRKHIFDKFYRAPTGNLHDVKGFGLGLSYVKAIMTAHKGQIDVESELGKGSSFILVFPFRISDN